MECSQMLGQTYSGAKGWAHSQSGLMTIYSAESPGNIYPVTTTVAWNGTTKYKLMGATGRRVAASGMEAKCSQMAQRRNLTRTTARSSKTWLIPRHDPLKIGTSLMQMPTLMHSQITWASNGSHPNPSPSESKFHTWVSGGTYTHKKYTYPMRKRPSIWQLLTNGKRSGRTISSRRKNSMANSSTWRWSSLQDVLCPDRDTLLSVSTGYL